MATIRKKPSHYKNMRQSIVRGDEILMQNLKDGLYAVAYRQGDTDQWLWGLISIGDMKVKHSFNVIYRYKWTTPDSIVGTKDVTDLADGMALHFFAPTEEEKIYFKTRLSMEYLSENNQKNSILMEHYASRIRAIESDRWYRFGQILKSIFRC